MDKEYRKSLIKVKKDSQKIDIKTYIKKYNKLLKNRHEIEQSIENSKIKINEMRTEQKNIQSNFTSFLEYKNDNAYKHCLWLDKLIHLNNEEIKNLEKDLNNINIQLEDYKNLSEPFKPRL